MRTGANYTISEQFNVANFIFLVSFPEKYNDNKQIVLKSILHFPQVREIVLLYCDAAWAV